MQILHYQFARHLSIHTPQIPWVKTMVVDGSGEEETRLGNHEHGEGVDRLPSAPNPD